MNWGLMGKRLELDSRQIYVRGDDVAKLLENDSYCVKASGSRATLHSTLALAAHMCCRCRII